MNDCKHSSKRIEADGRMRCIWCDNLQTVPKDPDTITIPRELFGRLTDAAIDFSCHLKELTGDTAGQSALSETVAQAVKLRDAR